MSRPVWTTLDAKTQLEIRGGGSRRFTLTTARKKKKTKKRGQDKLDKLDRLDKEDEAEKEENEKVSSHMTCHNILHQNGTSVRLVVYQKLEW